MVGDGVLEDPMRKKLSSFRAFKLSSFAFALAPIGCFVGSRTDLFPEGELDGAMPMDGGAQKDTGIDTGWDAHKYAWKATHCERDIEAGLPKTFSAPGGSDGDSGIFGETWAMPQAIPIGGPVIKRPLLVPISFVEDDVSTIDEIEDFCASVLCTPYWQAVAKDYGVGMGSSAPPVRLTEKAWTQIDDTGIAKWLRGKLDAKDPAFETPTSDTLYAIYVPYSTTVTLQGGTSCQRFLAYHNSTKLGNGQRVAYAVMPQCAGIEQLTAASSHEFIEAATDPYPNQVPAYRQTDEGHLPWSLFAGGEVADLCEFNDDANFKPATFPWTVQRSWSNSEAFLGLDPCAPASATPPYIAAIPDQPDVVHLFGNGRAMKGIKLSPGDTRMIALRLHAPVSMTPAWTVSVKDIAAFQGGPTRLQFSLNAGTGKDGDVLQLKISKLSNNTGSGLEMFLVFSTGGGKTTMYWATAGAN